MPVGHTVTQAWVLGEEGFRKLAGSSPVVSYMGTPMNCNAAEETKIVPKDVERNNSSLVAKPIRKAPKPQEQRLAIQNDLDIEHEGLFISPLGVGSSLVLEAQLFLLFHPVVRRSECFKPGRRPNGLVERKLLPIYRVSQLNLGADLERKARFDTLNDLALDLISDRAFQIQVEAKQECSPALLYSVFATLIDLVELLAGMLWVVQGIELFHEFVRKSPLPDDSLLFIEPSILLVLSETTTLSPASPGNLHIYRGFVFHRHIREGYKGEVFLQLVSYV